MIQAELNGQAGYVVWTGTDNEFFPTKEAAARREAELRSERERQWQRNAIANAIATYVHSARDSLKGQRDDCAKAIRRELNRTEEISELIRKGDLDAIRNLE